MKRTISRCDSPRLQRKNHSNNRCGYYIFFSGIPMLFGMIATVLLILLSDTARTRLNTEGMKIKLLRQSSYRNSVYDMFLERYQPGPLNVHQKCQDMMDNGHWVSEDLDHNSCKRDGDCRMTAWHPNSCTWKAYGKKETDQCLKKKKVVFVGDSRARQMFIGLRNKLRVLA